MVPRPHFQKLVEKTRMQAPLPAAVVYPCDRESLQLALSGAFAGYLAPTLVGPETRIRDLAGEIRPRHLAPADRRHARRAQGGRHSRSRTGPRRQGVGADQGQPEQRGPAGTRRRARFGAAHRPSPLACVLPGPAGNVARAAAGRRAPQRLAQPGREEGHRPQHDPARDMRSDWRRPTSRCSPRWTGRRRRSLPPPTPSR